MTETVQPILFDLVLQYQYLAVFLALFVAGFGLPIPEELSLFVAGYLAAVGLMDPLGTLITCYAGVISGDLATYCLGRWGAGWVLDLKFSRWLVPPGKLAKFRLSYRRWGPWVLVIARLLPGVRFPTFFSAGLVRMKITRFLQFDGLAAVVTVPILLGLAYLFGPLVWQAFHSIIELGDILGVLSLVIIASVLGYLLYIRLRNRPDRR